MKWMLESREIDEVVEARDQWEAYDTLKDRPLGDFGLIVTAQPANETNEHAVGVRTAFLFGTRWGDPIAAKAFVERGIELGLPDTTEQDILPS